MIVVAAGSPEADAIASTLRVHGLQVTDAPLAVLEARVIELSPRVILVDIDQPGAFDTVERLREHAPGKDAQIVCIGDVTRAAQLGIEAVLAFERPVDLERIIAEITEMGPPQPRPAVWREVDIALHSTMPIHVRESPVSSGVLRPEQVGEVELRPAMPLFSEAPGPPDRAELHSILPVSGEVRSSLALPTPLSPELEELLAAAESQVNAEESVPSIRIPSPQQEVDLILSPELLATLDEPLDDDDDEGMGTGSEYRANAGTGEGVRAPTPLHPTLSMQWSSGSQGSDALATMGTVALGTGEKTPTGMRAQGDKTPTGVRAQGEAFGAGTSTTRADSTPPGAIRDPAIPEASPNLRMPQPPRIADEIPPTETASPPPYQPAARPVPPPLPADSLQVAAIPVPPPPADSLQVTATPRAGSVSPSSPPPPPSPAIVVPAVAAPANFAPPARHIAAMAPSPGDAAPPTHVRHDRESVIVLGEGDAPKVLARAIASRFSGSVAIAGGTGTRRIVLHDGDVVTAGSELAGETLIAFLAGRGDLHRDVAARLAGKLAPSGRHAGAALIAQGHLAQDDLWPVLRAHAEWLIGMAVMTDGGTAEHETEPPGRLRGEPNVFGGAAGAEVFVDIVRRVVPPAVAIERLGGAHVRIDEGPQSSLLGECALATTEADKVNEPRARRVADMLDGSDAEFATVLYALVCLEILQTLATPEPRQPAGPPAQDPLDDEAVRSRIRARMMLVEDGDYFALLGVARTATSYEIRRAYLDLRRAFEPSHILTPATVDLAADVRTVIEVLDEAYDILRDTIRRERYLRAIEATPP